MTPSDFTVKNLTIEALEYVLGSQHFSLYHSQTIDFAGIFTDFKSVSNSEFLKAFVRPFFLLKSEGKRGEMRKNYFAKLVSYMKNVYHVDRGLNKLSDGRVNPTYSTGQNMR